MLVEDRGARRGQGGATRMPNATTKKKTNNTAKKTGIGKMRVAHAHTYIHTHAHTLKPTLASLPAQHDTMMQEVGAYVLSWARDDTFFKVFFSFFSFSPQRASNRHR